MTTILVRNPVQSFEANMTLRISESSIIEFINTKCARILIRWIWLLEGMQVYLQSITAKKSQMQLRIRDLEWWMRRRQLPPPLRLRVRQQERHRWAATRGVDEEALVEDLPEGLRRDIKRHLCVDLLRKVPLFQHFDDLILNNICDRLKPLLFTKGESVSSRNAHTQNIRHDPNLRYNATLN